MKKNKGCERKSVTMEAINGVTIVFLDDISYVTCIQDKNDDSLYKIDIFMKYTSKYPTINTNKEKAEEILKALTQDSYENFLDHIKD